MNKFDKLDDNQLYIGLLVLKDFEFKIIKKNPHTLEYFSNFDNIYDITDCASYLISKKMLMMTTKDYNKTRELIDKTKIHYIKCSNYKYIGYIYDFINIKFESVDYIINNNIFKIDKIKNITNYYKKKLIYRYSKIPYLYDYELTYPKPKSVVAYGQLKMFCVILLFFTKIIDKNKKYNVVYPGSAHGDNILLLSNMYPNINWYLIDPGTFNKKLYNHNNIIEIKNEFFLDETAHYYHNKLKNDNRILLFISDIRISTDENDVMMDNESQIRWHKILNPRYSYLKFRCPYDIKKYNYYKGKIYIQPYAPQSSTETRILLGENLIEKEYDTKEYNGKLFYHNRILRPSHYNCNNCGLFDKCFDCAFFYKIMKKYDNNNITDRMNYVVSELSKYSSNKIKITNLNISNHTYS